MHYISIWMSRPSMLEIMKKQIQLQAQPQPQPQSQSQPQPHARGRVRGSAQLPHAQLPQPRERIMRNQMCSQLGRDMGEGALPQKQDIW